MNSVLNTIRYDDVDKGAMAKITTSATSTTPASTMIYRSDLRVIRMLDDDNRRTPRSAGKTKEDAAAEGGARHR